MQFEVRKVDEGGRVRLLAVVDGYASIKSGFLDKEGRIELAVKLREAVTELERD